MNDDLPKPRMKQFAVWDSDGYWELFDSIEEGLSNEEREMYVLTAKKLGVFKVETTTTTRVVQVKPKAKVRGKRK